MQFSFFEDKSQEKPTTANAKLQQSSVQQTENSVLRHNESLKMYIDRIYGSAHSSDIRGNSQRPLTTSKYSNNRILSN